MEWCCMDGNLVNHYWFMIWPGSFFTTRQQCTWTSFITADVILTVEWGFFLCSAGPRHNFADITDLWFKLRRITSFQNTLPFHITSIATLDPKGLALGQNDYPQNRHQSPGLGGKRPLESCSSCGVSFSVNNGMTRDHRLPTYLSSIPWHSRRKWPSLVSIMVLLLKA